jgi:hypothetical protein
MSARDRVVATVTRLQQLNDEEFANVVAEDLHRRLKNSDATSSNSEAQRYYEKFRRFLMKLLNQSDA